MHALALRVVIKRDDPPKCCGMLVADFVVQHYATTAFRVVDPILRFAAW
jgi:hypothetical protein